MASLLLFPLHGVMLILTLVLLAVRLVALVDAIIRPEAAFRVAGKQTKMFWVVVLVIGMLIYFVGVIAALVYLIDVRPAVRGVSGRGSSSDGPYGPW